jgi:hypothetical protein
MAKLAAGKEHSVARIVTSISIRLEVILTVASARLCTLGLGIARFAQMLGRIGSQMAA